MRNRLIAILIFAATLLSLAEAFATDKPDQNTTPTEKSVEWIDIHVPKFPPLAYQARILGTVAIEVHFNGCELDPTSPHVLSGHPMLVPAAMESLKESTFRCGDFADSTATVSYEFGAYPAANRCEDGFTLVDVEGGHIRVLTTAACLVP
jgi:hypothetical protein